MHGRCSPLQQPVCQALHAHMEEVAVGCQPLNSKLFHVNVQNLSGRLMQKLAAPMQQTTEKTSVQEIPLCFAAASHSIHEVARRAVASLCSCITWVCTTVTGTARQAMHSIDKTCKNQHSPEMTSPCCVCNMQHDAVVQLEHFLPAVW